MTEAPEAEIIHMTPYCLTIRCPYCHGTHKHLRRDMTRGERTRRSPGCGLRATPDARLTGYWITNPTSN